MRSRIPGVFPQCEERLLMVIKSNRQGEEPREMVEPFGGKPRANERGT